MKLRALGVWFPAVLTAACGAPSIAERCGSTSVDVDCSAIAAYWGDEGYRRERLSASLVNPSNAYSMLRLRRYATGAADAWDRLPEYNPRVSLVREDETPEILGGPFGVSSDAAPLTISDGAKAGRIDALRDLGRDAFARYPVQLFSNAQYALATAERAETFGLWQYQGVGRAGIVRAEMADGSVRLAMTCRTCHARPTSSGVVDGLANAELDLGRLEVEASGASDALAEARLTWGRGRLDVSSVEGLEPVRIPDLRPLRSLSHLHADATVAKLDVAALAIRIETLIIVSNGEALRPPREIALGLALYLEELEKNLPVYPAQTPDEQRGRVVFEDRCASCHRSNGYTGPPVPLDVVGTDPRAGRSFERGTAMYRVPSLLGVSTRGPLLHDASLGSLDALFDPRRLDTTYNGGRLGVGAVPGHAFGLDVESTDRASLVAFLRTL